MQTPHKIECYKINMAALLQRQEIGIKKTGSSTTIPNSPVAKLMYYLDCVCSCVDAGNDSSLRRLRQFQTNYLSLSEQEEATLLILCLAVSPDKLIGNVFFPSEEIEGTNKFFELSAVTTKLVVSQSLLIGGQQKKVQKIMMFKKVWMERYYLEPLVAFTQRRQAPAQRQAPMLTAPPPQPGQYYNNRPPPYTQYNQYNQYGPTPYNAPRAHQHRQPASGSCCIIL